MQNGDILFIALEVVLILVLVLFGIRLFPKVRAWFEVIIAKVITDVVNSFWDQQSHRIQEARRQRDKKQKEERDRKAREVLTDGILLDTSVLIDGRILDIAKTGFLASPLIVPKVVLNELHLISDSDDKIKRQKGRRGLDILKNLRDVTKVIVFTSHAKENAVDSELIAIAKRFKIRLMTLDFNLNKVANVSGVKVLNINELVNAVKLTVLPGEEITVHIVQEGKEKEQGVGYMPDGTMIVVDKAKDLIGNDVTAKVSRVIQTNAGKMIFCNLM
jgi:uncharacterized protein YacL